ncbi:hypothetical protein BDV41DRAFT_49730 [Aspergillus transmontanensis]|uniref:Uncharacterized protein n=1 Tax=Aspergillus transmontanensis TaxID=1034304 RepID=A0A5N6VGR6_9EURO|nr:hypothetical protein BDV41DRAFT_49730 [Aspergillus transmontanensis]
MYRMFVRMYMSPWTVHLVTLGVTKGLPKHSHLIMKKRPLDEKNKKKSAKISDSLSDWILAPFFFVLFSRYMVASIPLFTHLPGARYYNYVGSLP